jgi:hypothetical protein
VRHFLGVHVFLDRRIGRRAQRLEDQQHLVAFDELARLFDRFLISVSLAPGSYFSSAPAALAEIAEAAANAAKAKRLVQRAGILPSRLLFRRNVASRPLAGKRGPIRLCSVGCAKRADFGRDTISINLPSSSSGATALALS